MRESPAVRTDTREKMLGADSNLITPWWCAVGALREQGSRWRTLVTTAQAESDEAGDLTMPKPGTPGTHDRSFCSGRVQVQKPSAVAPSLPQFVAR